VVIIMFAKSVVLATFIPNIPTLGYWDIRDLAQPFRYLLKCAEIEFNDKRYEFGEGATLVESELLLVLCLIVRTELSITNLSY
jgi:hypothetical protein